MCRESLVGLQVGEGFHERDESVLHQAEGTEPEDEKPRDCERTPMPVEVLLHCLMEDTITTIEMG